MSNATTHKARPKWRLALALGVAAALGAASLAVAQPPYHRVGPPVGGVQPHGTPNYGHGAVQAHRGPYAGPAPTRGISNYGSRAPTYGGRVSSYSGRVSARPPYHGSPTGPAPPRNAAPPGWDQRQHNGYWVGGRWYSGAPPSHAYRAPSYRPGFTPWRRGAYLPPQYQGFVVSEWSRYHLRRPPVGYNWVQVGNEYLLISASTGLIFDVVTSY